MGKATEELIKTHRLVEKILEQFHVHEPRFAEIRTTLERAVVAHAWLQDEILAPVLEGNTLVDGCFLIHMAQEHATIHHLIKRLIVTPLDATPELEALVLQIRTLLESHFADEVQALYPLAEQVVDAPTLFQLGEQMERRKLDVRDVIHV